VLRSGVEFFMGFREPKAYSNGPGGLSHDRRQDRRRYRSSDQEPRASVSDVDLNLKEMSKIRNLWAHADDPADVEFLADVPSHGVVMLPVEGK
jgi:hypothetical protein